MYLVMCTGTHKLICFQSSNIKLYGQMAGALTAQKMKKRRQRRQNIFECLKCPDAH